MATTVYDIGIYDTILYEDFGLFFLMLSGSTLLRHLAQFYCAIYKKTVTNDKGEKTKVLYASEISEDPKLLKLLTPFQDKGQEALKIKVGKSTGEFMGKRDVVRSQPTNLGVLIGTAMREKVKADFAVMNSGGIRESLPEGDLAYRDVLKVQPFGNQISYVDL